MRSDGLKESLYFTGAASYPLGVDDEDCAGLPGNAIGAVFEQCRFADAGFTMDECDRQVARSRGLPEAVEFGYFLIPSYKALLIHLFS
jgi:hypothetical protein